MNSDFFSRYKLIKHQSFITILQLILNLSAFSFNLDKKIVYCLKKQYEVEKSSPGNMC